MEPVVIRASDIDSTPTEFPKVVRRNRKPLLQLDDDREYEIPNDPIKALGLLHHFAGKNWADRRFFFYAITRIAETRGWRIHPFNA
jgi:hypothetical protein